MPQTKGQMPRNGTRAPRSTGETTSKRRTPKVLLALAFGLAMRSPELREELKNADRASRGAGFSTPIAHDADEAFAREAQAKWAVELTGTDSWRPEEGDYDADGQRLADEEESDFAVVDEEIDFSSYVGSRERIAEVEADEHQRVIYALRYSSPEESGFQKKPVADEVIDIYRDSPVGIFDGYGEYDDESDQSDRSANLDDDEFRSDWERTYASSATNMFVGEPTVSDPRAKAKRIYSLREKIRRAKALLFEAQAWRRIEAERIRRSWGHDPWLMGCELARLEWKPMKPEEFRAFDQLRRFNKRLDRVVKPAPKGLNAAMFVVARDPQEDREALAMLAVPLATKLPNGQRHVNRHVCYERHLARRRGLPPRDERGWTTDLTDTAKVVPEKRWRRDGKRDRAADRTAWIQEIGRVYPLGLPGEDFLDELYWEDESPDQAALKVAEELEAAQARKQSLENLGALLRYVGWSWWKTASTPAQQTWSAA